MLRAAWPHVWGDLASIRRGAAEFLDHVEGIFGAVGRQSWIARWTNVGDSHYALCDLSLKNGASAKAAEAWLCALTAFEVAKRLLNEANPQSEEISAKIEAGIQRFGLSLEQKVERVQIPCWDQAELFAYYLPAGGPDLCAPAVICISREEETRAGLLGRLLPAVVGQGISILVVSHDDVSNRWRGQSEIPLGCCLDYLSDRPGVDPARIGVYGDGWSAVLATDFAISDGRVAAAVCDGGLWNSARTLASIGWMTKTADVLDEDVVSVRRSRLVRQFCCPVLVVAGGHGTVSVSEANKLQADCTAARIDLELAVPRMTRTPIGEIENFVSSDDQIFRWLNHKLAAR